MPRKHREFEDSIVGDVRRARAALLAKFGNDVGRLCEYLMEEQKKYPGRVVNRGRKMRHLRRTLKTMGLPS